MTNSIIDYILETEGKIPHSFFRIIRNYCAWEHKTFLFGEEGKDDKSMYNWIYDYDK